MRFVTKSVRCRDEITTFLLFDITWLAKNIDFANVILMCLYIKLMKAINTSNII